MKTKEIDVHINPESVKNERWISVFINSGYESIQEGYLSARLIISLPERKVEITESEFDEATKGCKYICSEYADLKKKLFGKEQA